MWQIKVTLLLFPKTLFKNDISNSSKNLALNFSFVLLSEVHSKILKEFEFMWNLSCFSENICCGCFCLIPRRHRTSYVCSIYVLCLRGCFSLFMQSPLFALILALLKLYTNYIYVCDRLIYFEKSCTEIPHLVLSIGEVTKIQIDLIWQPRQWWSSFRLK